jgi:fumagillin biosynthesis cytochrome P450 monooxygenase
MLHDPQTYVNPDKFDPSRFLGSNPEPDPREVFGFGRRICPGRFLADSSIFIACAMILASMNISKLLDGNGKEIRPQARWSGNIVM